ncbi:MAG TPA: hypothetical protein PK954_26290 [Anaerolineales bacterium]|nr:hypothetical protein [Anaerolineales bacterium]
MPAVTVFVRVNRVSAARIRRNTPPVHTSGECASTSWAIKFAIGFGLGL